MSKGDKAKSAVANNDVKLEANIAFLSNSGVLSELGHRA